METSVTTCVKTPQRSATSTAEPRPPFVSITERKHIVRSVGIVIALVATTVVAAGAPIMLIQQLESDRPLPAHQNIEQPVDGR